MSKRLLVTCAMMSSWVSLFLIKEQSFLAAAKEQELLKVGFMTSMCRRDGWHRDPARLLDGHGVETGALKDVFKSNTPSCEVL